MSEKEYKSSESKIDAKVNDIQKTLHKNLDFAATEQYKLLRTNLSFTLPDEKKCFVIGVTSSVRGEGKSTTSINLSYVLAEAGKKVLLVDGDLRIPSIAKKMDLQRTPGLTNLIIDGNYDQIENYRAEEFEKWYIVPAGDLPPNPSELLGSRKMEKFINAVSEDFDYIIIDLPPVNIVSDTLAISRLLDGVLLVVRQDYTSKKDIDDCVSQLKLSNVKVLGFVMNVIRGEGAGYRYRYRYGYRRYSKYYKKYGYKYGYEDAKNSNSVDNKKD